MTNIYEYLANNEYPGRGIIVGRKDGKRLIAYFIMGRSANSRNRVFAKKEEILFTKAYDESKVKDPSLIIYNAVRPFKEKTIVTNGDQTDTIYEYLVKGSTFADALDSREYEPDAPNYTPRISAIIDDKGYRIAILKRKGEECERLFYDYERQDGTGHFISTYDHDGNPLPSFSKDPLEVKIDENFEDFSRHLWVSLNEKNKVSLYVRINDREIIFNRNEGD
jgi:IMP cyclohydrolase